MKVRCRVEIEQEEDGRLIAEVVEPSGSLAYGDPAEVALTHVQALALRGLADRREHGEGWPHFIWAFHDRDESGPRMQARIAKHTGLRPQDL